MTHQELPDKILKSMGRRYDEITLVATFQHPLTAQIHREAMGCWFNVDAYSSYRNISAKVLIIRNDSHSGLFGLQKGSNLPPIQYASIHIHKRCIERGAFPIFLHATGLQLIEEGQDDGSRVHSEKLRGPACGAGVKQHIAEFTRRVGKPISVDMFAAACNALTAHFMAWTLEPSAERINAFSARSWDDTMCLHCGLEHCEVGFYFPPSNLEDTIVRRAR